MREVKPAEPIVIPKRRVKPKPNKNDPWTVPYPYDPKKSPQPTPRAMEV
jgi:hypothetical protein